MARNDKQRTVRQQDDFRQGRRDVVLNTSKRFFTASGNDQATRQARALTGALGVGVDLYTDVIEDRNTKGGARAAQEAAEGGERNAEDTNKGYNEVFDKVEAATDLADLASTIAKRSAAEGWMDLPEEELQGKLDELYKGELVGINPDSTYGKIVAEGILNQNAKLLNVYRTGVAEELQQEKRIMIRNKLRGTIENLDPAADDYSEQLTAAAKEMFGEMNTLVPGPGGRATTVEAWQQVAEELGLPEMYDAMPSNFENGEPTGKDDPNLFQDFQASIGRAEAKRDALIKERNEEHAADFQTERAAAHSQLTTRAKAGDPTVIYDIFAGGEDGEDGFPPRLLKRGEQKLLLDQLATAQADGRVTEYYGRLYGAGKAIDLSDADYSRAAEQYAEEVDKMYARENPDWTEEEREANVLKVVVERSVAMGRVPTYIGLMMDATPAAGERFQDAYNVKRMYDTYDKELAQTVMTDRNAIIMDAYGMTLADTGNEEGALEAVSQYDRTIAESRPKALTEITGEVAEQLANDKPFWGDYDVTYADTKHIERLAKHYMNLGYDDDRIVRFVRNGMKSRTVRVQGQLYGVNEGWRAGEPAAEHYLASVAPEFFADAADLELVPHPTIKGRAVVKNKTAMMPYAAPSIEIGEIENRYDAHAHDQLIQAVANEPTNTLSDRSEVALQRAKDKAIPPPTRWVLQGQEEGHKRRQERVWSELSEDDRRRLFEAETLAMAKPKANLVPTQ